VQAEVERSGRDLLRAKATAILNPSPARVEPPCPYFGRCGGCHYQQAAYAHQLEQKVLILRETLRRIGKLEAPEEIDVISGEPYGYRNRVQLHARGSVFGYLEAGSHALCPIDQCLIASPRINAAIREVTAGRRFPRGVETIELFTNEEELQVTPGAGAPIEYRVGADLYRVSRNSFFQVNRFLIEALIERALEGAQGEIAMDLYAGAGLFTLPLGRRFREVEAVETGGSALRDLEFNARRAGVSVRTHRASVDLYLEKVERTPDFALADPPRAGLGKHAVRQLLRIRPARLTIVSCDPATLARDLASLAAGGYTVTRMTLADLFPQTCHIETVVELRPA